MVIILFAEWLQISGLYALHFLYSAKKVVYFMEHSGVRLLPYWHSIKSGASLPNDYDVWCGWRCWLCPLQFDVPGQVMPVDHCSGTVLECLIFTTSVTISFILFRLHQSQLNFIRSRLETEKKADCWDNAGPTEERDSRAHEISDV